MSAGMMDNRAIYPFKVFGLEGPFWAVHIDILMASWIAMAILFGLVILARIYMKKEHHPITAAFENIVTIFMGLCKDSFSYFNYSYFAFVTTLFFFTLFSCLVGIIPYVEEATRDLNTTLALGLTSFLYIQYQKIRVHGIGGYLKEFIEPFFLLAPIHVVGELSKIASMSFRLFGNILGGGIILSMVIDLVGTFKVFYLGALILTLLFLALAHIFSFSKKMQIFASIGHFVLNLLFILSWMQVFLGIFEGMIQSFVITMLTVTYLAIGTQHDESTGTHNKNHNDHHNEPTDAVTNQNLELHEQAERTAI